MRVKAKPKYRNAVGDVIPSVTAALSELNKPALVRWANKLGLQGIDSIRYRDEIADVGTLTHYLIMCWLQQEIPDTSEFTSEQVDLANECFKKYLEWESRNPVKCVFSELPLISEKYQYGGTPDLYAVCSGELVLVDFKTSATGIFPEMMYQVSAYRRLVQEAGYRVSKTLILRLGRGSQEGAEEKIFTDYELDNGFEIFTRCLDIYRLKRGDEHLCTELIQ